MLLKFLPYILLYTTNKYETAKKHLSKNVLLMRPLLHL